MVIESLITTLHTGKLRYWQLVALQQQQCHAVCTGYVLWRALLKQVMNDHIYIIALQGHRTVKKGE